MQKLEEEESMAKNAEIKARMDRVAKKVGKAMMPRSTKKKLKKEVVVVKVDEDRLDFQRYLGEDMAEMVDEIKEKNGGQLFGSTVSKNSSIIQPQLSTN